MSKRFPEPSISRKYLFFGAGLFWTLGGIILISKAVMLSDFDQYNSTGLILLGLTIGFVKYKFLFSKVVKKNISRINLLSPNKEKICLFAFQSIESYILVIIMITMGILIRTLGVPHNILFVIYLAIGMALLLASLGYYKVSR